MARTKKSTTSTNNKTLENKIQSKPIPHTPIYKTQWFWIGSLSVLAATLIFVNTALIAYNDNTDLVARAANFLEPSKTTVSSSKISSVSSSSVISSSSLSSISSSISSSSSISFPDTLTVIRPDTDNFSSSTSTDLLR